MPDLKGLEPTQEDLEEIEQQESTEAHRISDFDNLEDLYTDAIIAQRETVKRKKHADPALRDSVAAASKRMRETFSLDENWERTRAVAFIDRDSGTLLGNFSEYLHRSVPGCKKFLREHSPIPVSGVEYVTGWLGENMAMKRDEWGRHEDQREAIVDLWLDELMIGSPAVHLIAAVHLGGITRAELATEVQFASQSGNTVLHLPAGTNVFPAMSTDSKIALRKEIHL